MNVKPTLHAWDKCHFVMTYWHFYILLHSICECFLKDFASLFVRDIGLSFFSLIVSLSHSGVSVTLTNENCWEVSLTLGKKLLETWCHFFLRRVRCHPHSHRGFPGVFAGRFLITSATDLMDTGLFQPLISSVQSLLICVLQQTRPFHLPCLPVSYFNGHFLSHWLFPIPFLLLPWGLISSSFSSFWSYWLEILLLCWCIHLQEYPGSASAASHTFGQVTSCYSFSAK